MRITCVAMILAGGEGKRLAPLTRDRVLRAAVDLADRGGNEALSSAIQGITE